MIADLQLVVSSEFRHPQEEVEREGNPHDGFTSQRQIGDGRPSSNSAGGRTLRSG